MPMRNKHLLAAAAVFILVLGVAAGWHYTENNFFTTWISSYFPIKSDEPKINGIPILMYHKINPNPRLGGLGITVTPNNFNWQMNYLKKNGYHTVSLNAVTNHVLNNQELPEKPIVITIDDGYYDNYHYAYPILKKYGFTATIFIVSNTVGGFNDFDYKARIYPKMHMLTWGEIKEMSNNGISFGSHTADHKHLTKIKPEEARRQINQSKKNLEKRLGKKVQFFCYPYGEYNQAVAGLVKESGYKAATTTQLGLVDSNSDPFLFKRISVPGYLNHQQFVEELHRY